MICAISVLSSKKDFVQAKPPAWPSEPLPSARLACCNDDAPTFFTQKNHIQLQKVTEYIQKTHTTGIRSVERRNIGVDDLCHLGSLFKKRLRSSKAVRVPV
jgi:hypothetical protein